MSAPARARLLFADGFRPFFLAAGIFGPLQLLAWIAALGGLIAPPAGFAPSVWHAHEMLFGWTAAAIAGFLLTAVPVWTRTTPLRGGPLVAVFALWLLGRLGVVATGAIPATLAAAVDVAFLLVLALAVGLPILRAGQRRNYGFPAVLVGLATANAAVHAEASGALSYAFGQAGLRLGVHLVALLVAIVGGRITPAFTSNALRRRGLPAEIRPRAWVERLVVPGVLLAALADLAAPRSTASGLAALLAGVVLALRMTPWRTRETLSDPLLWSLHAGYAWLALGFALVGVADLGGGIPWSSGLHALTAGGFGAMILAVMTRVPLGHTGRPLAAPSRIPLAYLLVSVGALVRVVGPAVLPAQTLPLLVAAALAWAAAFALFAFVYAPILAGPRVGEG